MRLNKEIRNQIVKNAFIASPIIAARKALTVRSIALSEKIRLDSLETPTLDVDLKTAEKEIKLILKKRGIPDGQCTSNLFTQYPGVPAVMGEMGRTTVYFNGAICTYGRHSCNPNEVEPDRNRDYSAYRGAGDTKEYPAHHEFVQEYRALINEGKQLIEDEKVLRNTVRAAVDSFNTTEKLIEHWPEAEALLPKEVSKSNAPMPIALQVEVLNSLIGLPKE